MARIKEYHRLGLMHICIGNGVGKSTRSIGLAVRAAGNGFMVDFVQFMKSGDSGEVNIFNRLPAIRYHCPGKHPFLISGEPTEVQIEHARKALEYAWKAIDQGTDLLIVDEILDTMLYNTLPLEKIMELARTCRGKVELVMTGRRAPGELLEMADYVTEFVEVKHPYQKEIKARKGIEY